jgi:hypothetical protein
MVLGCKIPHGLDVPKWKAIGGRRRRRSTRRRQMNIKTKEIGK